MNRTKRAGRLTLAALAMSAAWPAWAQPVLHDVFTDHAVLQQGRPVPVWGTADANARLTVELGTARVRTVADASGAWRATLPVMQPGGPYTLTVTDAAGRTTTRSDIMVGDVYLCSGQSNMEWTVRASMNADNEIRRAANPRIRMLTVPRASNTRPQAAFARLGQWQVTSPETVGDFSATCYYFARELQTQVDVPIGLISASWGGSAIESWISAAPLRAMGNGPLIDLLDQHAQDPAAAQAGFGAMWQNWWTAQHPGAGTPWTDGIDGAGWYAAPTPLRDWKRWGDPDLAQHNGMVWFRKSFELTAAQAAAGGVVHLGGIDEIDATWVNGQPVGHSFGWGDARSYPVPAAMLRAGRNDIIINVYSGWDAGGLYGPAEVMRLALPDGSSVPLGEGWQVKKAPPGAGNPPRAPWFAVGGLTTMRNAMIAPLRDYGLRGVLWYQGESNADNPAVYQAQLAAMMRDWRGQFGQADLPFLIVQLPNFGQPVTRPTNSNWSRLREAQRLAVKADANAALAVLIDAGEDGDIHPPNKQIVGTRLARAARHVVYRQPVTPSGPALQSVTRGDGVVRVTFTDIDGALVTRSASSPIAFELCDTAGACAFAAARIAGDSVLIDAPNPAAVAEVRYCWGDAPVCNLYDGAGLPAGPFAAALP